MLRIPAYFHPDQLRFKPLYEWAFGDKIDHPETTARAENILAALTADERFLIHEPAPIPPEILRDTHSFQLLTLYNTARQLEEGTTFYPSVFPRAEQTAGDPTNLRHAGRFCFDSGTPLSAETWNAATWSAACALSAASAVRSAQSHIAYALSRPPGHHATHGYFGGYSYLNNSVIAAKHLQERGTVAVVDIDFHHGNGTQDFFYDDPSVLTVSIHGDPRDYYPFFQGFADESGAAEGLGFNINVPLPGHTTGEGFVEALEAHVIPAVKQFAPDWLVVAAGFDTYHKDPVGEFGLETPHYAEVGARIGALGLRTVVVQEGGYYTPDLGANVVSFLGGLLDAWG